MLSYHLLSPPKLSHTVRQLRHLRRQRLWSKAQWLWGDTTETWLLVAQLRKMPFYQFNSFTGRLKPSTNFQPLYPIVSEDARCSRLVHENSSTWWLDVDMFLFEDIAKLHVSLLLRNHRCSCFFLEYCPCSRSSICSLSDLIIECRVAIRPCHVRTCVHVTSLSDSLASTQCYNDVD